MVVIFQWDNFLLAQVHRLVSVEQGIRTTSSTDHGKKKYHSYRKQPNHFDNECRTLKSKKAKSPS